MENPVLRARELVRMSQAEFAIALGVSRAVVHAAETGANRRISESLLDALERQGYDRKKISEEFEIWREARRANAQQTLLSRVGGNRTK